MYRVDKQLYIRKKVLDKYEFILYLKKGEQKVTKRKGKEEQKITKNVKTESNPEKGDKNGRKQKQRKL